MKQFSRVCMTYLLISFSCLLYTKTSFAALVQDQSKSSQSVSVTQQEFNASFGRALRSAIQGPATIELLNQGTLKIPADFLFIPKKESEDLIVRIDGTPMGSTFIGVIVPNDVKALGLTNVHSIIMVYFIPSGHLMDGDAKSWGADDLMTRRKEINNEENKERISAGFSPLEIIGWEDEPKYDALTHHWVWSYLIQDKDIDHLPSMAYYAYAFGRYGYFELSFVTPNTFIFEDELTIQDILSTLHFYNGKRYEDFNENTDLAFGYSPTALLTVNTDVKLIYFFMDKLFLFLYAMVGTFILIISVWLWKWIEKRFRIKNNDISIKANK